LFVIAAGKAGARPEPPANAPNAGALQLFNGENDGLSSNWLSCPDCHFPLLVWRFFSFRGHFPLVCAMTPRPGLIRAALGCVAANAMFWAVMAVFLGVTP
jgi:hypothetical protein